MQVGISWNPLSEVGIFYSENIYKTLKDFGVFSKGIGTPILSKRTYKNIVSPYVICKYECFFLYEEEKIYIEKNEDKFINSFSKEYKDNNYIVYKNIRKKKDVFVEVGQNYGVNFVVYKNDPNIIHSEYLVVNKDKEEKLDIEEILTKERVSVNTKKKLILAFVGEEDNIENNINNIEKDNNVDFIEIKWVQI